MEHTEFLYHYTSIHNLALILKNKTFRFCNLLNVDDPDEAYTSDLGSAGKYALVSCWTATNEDVLPMWSMYTTNMSGVRIKMKKNPFKVYQYEPGELHFKEKVESNINYYDENICKYAIAPSCPKLIKVEYTNDESLLYPKICIENGDNVTISFEKMGKEISPISIEKGSLRFRLPFFDMMICLYIIENISSFHFLTLS